MFRNCTDEASIKKLYRRIASFLHPDKGGEIDLMVMLTNAYERALSEFKNLDKKNSKPFVKYENIYIDIPYDLEDERFGIFEEIYEYSKKNPKYKTDFLESVMEYVEKNGWITSSQYNSLVKSYYTFRMDKQDLKEG